MLIKQPVLLSTRPAIATTPSKRRMLRLPGGRRTEPPLRPVRHNLVSAGFPAAGGRPLISPPGVALKIPFESTAWVLWKLSAGKKRILRLTLRAGQGVAL